jgi:hypothetical protein
MGLSTAFNASKPIPHSTVHVQQSETNDFNAFNEAARNAFTCGEQRRTNDFNAFNELNAFNEF